MGVALERRTTVTPRGLVEIGLHLPTLKSNTELMKRLKVNYTFEEIVQTTQILSIQLRRL